MADIIGTDGPDNLTGTDHSDSIDGAGGDDTIDGAKGADTILGGAGNDRIYGGGGADLVQGGDGDDWLIAGATGGYGSSEPGNTLEGGAGDDTLFLHLGDTVDGGVGADHFSLNLIKSDLLGGSFDLRGLDKHGSASFLDTTISNVEGGSFYGTEGDDTFLVGATPILISGAGGNDHIAVKGASDASGGDGDDLITGGGKSNNFTGNAGADTIIGGGGLDFLSGVQGDDRLVGGKDAMLMNGGTGDDLLIAKSADTLLGGSGSDVFQLVSLAGAGSQILDLDDLDAIDLRKVDADVTQAGNQRFALVGAFDGHAGQAVLEVVSGTTYLRLDVDGDGTADATLTMSGDHSGFDGLLL